MSAQPFVYKAGCAAVCITPEEPLWLAGYAVRKAPAGDKISDLYASAVALADQAGQRLVIASLDNLAINPAIADRVAENLQTRHGLARHELLLSATHTHYAPEFRSNMHMFYHIPKEYVAKMSTVTERLVSGLTNAIEQALVRMRPVRLFARRASASFAHNRRRRGVVAGTPSPEDVFDHDVPVLDCIDRSGKHEAIVFGYACHQTTIQPDDLRYCGDWAGFAKEQLQREHPGAVVLFIPGASADQDPEPRGALELSRRYGSELATSVTATFGAGTEISGPIRIGWADVSLPLEPVTDEMIDTMMTRDDPPQRVKAKFLRELKDQGEEFMTSYSAPLQVVRFGCELLIIALSGEPVVDWAHKFKREFERCANSDLEAVQEIADTATPASAVHGRRYPLVWVAGYCNDIFDYLPTHRIQVEGGYEGGRANLWNPIPAPVTREAEHLITESVRDLVERVSE